LKPVEMALDNRPKCFIDGKYRESATIIGYCHCKTHKGYLTMKLLRQHECLSKQCRFLQRFEEEPFWTQQEKMKAKRKLRKENQRRIKAQQSSEETDT